MYVTFKIYDHMLAIPLEDFNSLHTKLVFLEGYNPNQKIVSPQESEFEIRILLNLPEPENETTTIFKKLNNLAIENEKLKADLKELTKLYEDK